MRGLDYFSQFLSTSGPGGHAWARAAGLSEEHVRLLRSHYSDIVDMGVSRERIVGALGDPSRVQDGKIAYRDVFDRHRITAEHEFVFSLQRPVGWCAIGFRRHEQCPALPEMPAHRREFGAFIDKLHRLGVDSDELEMRYGAPSNSVGWWPIETFDYGGGRRMDLRHGVVYRAT